MRQRNVGNTSTRIQQALKYTSNIVHPYEIESRRAKIKYKKINLLDFFFRFDRIIRPSRYFY
uniref:Uncharacterized protein n=1 Tax=Utricularia reniformis TaxID=192314 RepID=A0A1Y0B0C1_9LAMI|nr:hypothetical protein AEK19_MT0572 [Utricularia reniformis]ART30828.1 hypothetical protein AEK19_MT0572 [Utricularia reniformis]